jgi:hypothetical protein
MNLPENRICGRCGASLPLVYDGEGNVSGSGRNLRMEAFLNQTAHRRARASPTSIGWILRLGVILFAIFIAFRILHRK